MICFDCKKEIKGEYMPYKDDIVKCKKCHQKEPVIKNFQPCEVYSRVVGYIRPVGQWNEGKKAEYSDRKVFKTK